MNDDIKAAAFAFNILLASALNESRHLIPDDAPYNISHFFSHYGTNLLHANMRDGRALPLTYETRPNVNIDCFYVNVYFESPLYMNPILSIVMDAKMLASYKRLVEVFFEASMSKQEQSGVPISELTDNSIPTILL